MHIAHFNHLSYFSAKISCHLSDECRKGWILGRSGPGESVRIEPGHQFSVLQVKWEFQPSNRLLRGQDCWSWWAESHNKLTTSNSFSSFSFLFLWLWFVPWTPGRSWWCSSCSPRSASSQDPRIQGHTYRPKIMTIDIYLYQKMPRWWCIGPTRSRIRMPPHWGLVLMGLFIIFKYLCIYLYLDFLIWMVGMTLQMPDWPQNDINTCPKTPTVRLVTRRTSR